MGSSKSFRMSDRTENMFNSIKKHDVTSSRTDTEILSYGIELQFEMTARSCNHYYRKKVSEFLNSDKKKQLFGKLCDMLEPMSYSDGYFLEDEVRYFMNVVAPDYFLDAYDDNIAENVPYQQYHITMDIITAQGIFKDNDFFELAFDLDTFYEIENKKK